MAKIRVYELAKDLNMTNKALLDKLKVMNIEVKSHMSSLDDDTVKQIRSEVFGKKADPIEETRIQKTVIRRRKKQPPVEEQPAEPEFEAAPEPETEISNEDTAASETTPAEEVPAETEVKAEKIEEVEAEEIVDEVSAEAETKAEETEPVQPEEKTAEPDKTEAPASTEIDTADKVSDEPVKKPEPEKKMESARIIKAPEKPKEEISEKEPVEAAPVEETKPEPEKPKAAKTKKKQKKFTAAKIIKLPDAPVIPAPVKKAAEEPERPRKKGKGPAKAAPKFAEEAPLPPKDGKPGKKGQKTKHFEKDLSEDKPSRKKKGHKRKSVVEGTALYADNRKGKGRKGSHKPEPKPAQKTQITTPKAIKRRVKIDDTIALSELAKRMGIKANEMIAKLMSLGVMATVNQTIDFDTASLVAAEFEYEVERAAFEEEAVLNAKSSTDEDPSVMSERPPVVTIMGHVDHGKTSLLDVIRKSTVADVEAGGITQHIGAYSVKTPNGRIAFLDTPGHEAFTSMRSRGAQVTDIVILVVAADDGVMPQTVEALNHAKAAEVPIIVAVNKMDKEDADPDRVKRELSDHGVVSEEWGGDTIFVSVSAKTELGIDDLLEMILLQSEVLELRANPDKLAKGHVIESKLDSGRGAVATVLIQEGTLETGQPIVCGVHHGKIRAMIDDKGRTVKKAGPSTPVEILGLSGVPMAGDELVALVDEKDAKQVSTHRTQKLRAKELAKSSRLSLEGLFERMEEGEVKDLNLIIKADVHGSIEALKDSLGKLSTSEVKINVVHAATGTITESDVSLATVSNAIILGFNVRPGAKVHEFAKEENVDMRFYDIIYNAIKDIKDAMVGLMESTYEERVLGRAEVRDIFVIPKKGTVAGCFITDGKIERGKNVRVLREGVIKFDGRIASLRRFKDDVKEVATGYECGIGIENFNDIKVGDTIDCYFMEEIKPTLDA